MLISIQPRSRKPSLILFSLDAKTHSVCKHRSSGDNRCARDLLDRLHAVVALPSHSQRAVGKASRSAHRNGAGYLSLRAMANLAIAFVFGRVDSGSSGQHLDVWLGVANESHLWPKSSRRFSSTRFALSKRQRALSRQRNSPLLVLLFYGVSSDCVFLVFFPSC
jgi:hypothetical protein